MSSTSSIITRTIWSSLLQTCLLSRRPLVVYPSTTLNERFELFPDAKLQEGETTAFGYYAIGDKGHYNSVEADGTTIINAVKHLPSDAACFNPVPFVIREEKNDLPPELRKHYALRQSVVSNGVQYFYYWLKRIDLSKSSPIIEHTTVTNGVPLIEDYIPDRSNLYPSRPILNPSEAVTSSSEYLTVTMPVTVDFNDQDVEELFNVARILHNNEKRAIVSEIALCSGLDRLVPAIGTGGAAFQFQESIVTQVLAFISTYQQMSFNTRGFNMELELGATEPMLTGSDLSQAALMDVIMKSRTAQFNNVRISNL